MATSSKAYKVTTAQLKPEWHVIDASGQTLGRLATQIATLLQGKHKPIYTPHLKTGDFVIVINASKIKVTGQKMEKKVYYWHTGYPGGIRGRSLREMLAKNPTQVIKRSVKGMLPKSRLGVQLIRRLTVYAGESHPHQAQVKGSLKVQAVQQPNQQ